MKKFLVVLACLVVILFESCGAKTIDKKILGSWESDSIVYTFSKDSLYIDEIGVEGDQYSYVIDTSNKEIIYKNEIDEYFDVLKIVSVTNETLVLKMDGETYKFSRIKDDK